LQLFEPNRKISAITSGVLAVLGAKPEDNLDTFSSSTFICANKLSSDQQEFVVFRSVLDITKLTPSSSRTNALTSLANWVSKSPQIQDGTTLYNVLHDVSCSLEILSIEQALCPYNGITVGESSAVASPTDAGTATALGILLAISIIISVVIVVAVVSHRLYRKNRRCYEPNAVG